jgi:hypothetical protein
MAAMLFPPHNFARPLFRHCCWSKDSTGTLFIQMFTTKWAVAFVYVDRQTSFSQRRAIRRSSTRRYRSLVWRHGSEFLASRNSYRSLLSTYWFLRHGNVSRWRKQIRQSRELASRDKTSLVLFGPLAVHAADADDCFSHVWLQEQSKAGPPLCVLLTKYYCDGRGM